MSIPATEIVSVNPGVISSGGTSLALNGLFLSQSLLLPSNRVISFASADEVGAYFGLSSLEYKLSDKYFSGYDNSTLKPNALLFAPYRAANVAAFLRSGSLASMTLAQLKALTGTLTIELDGTEETSSAINLSTATSFSSACDLIEAAFETAPVVTWNAVLSAFEITSPTTGASSTLTFATGTLADSLKLTQATGAVLSQGDVADTPATALNKAVANSQNWVSVVPLWEPLLADKEAFASWLSGKKSRFIGIIYDTDAQAIVSGATTPFGVVAKAAQYDGVIAITGDANVAADAGVTLLSMLQEQAAFVAGTIASINFAQKNGRITLAFRSQSGLVPAVNDDQIYKNLIANGYSCYGIFATANQTFTFFNNSQLPGKWKWADSFVNQVYLNSQLQSALLILITAVNAIPYNAIGYNMIRAALLDPIKAAINFGSIRVGIVLSESQRAQVDAAAGMSIHAAIEAQGFYLQILDPGAEIRGNRGTPVINLWYTDGQAVQQITLASISIQ